MLFVCLFVLLKLGNINIYKLVGMIQEKEENYISEDNEQLQAKFSFIGRDRIQY